METVRHKPISIACRRATSSANQSRGCGSRVAAAHTTLSYACKNLRGGALDALFIFCGPLGYNDSEGERSQESPVSWSIISFENTPDGKVFACRYHMSGCT